FPGRRPHMRRQRVGILRAAARGNAVWLVTNQRGESARAQPGETAVLPDAPECEAPVALDAVPAERGRSELFSRHGFDGVTINGLHNPDFLHHLLNPV